MINPITPSNTKKIFKEYFAPELEKRGFMHKKEVWVRKVGEIFEVIGTDSVCIRLFVSPYWINDTSKTSNFIDYNRKGSARLSSCGNINFPLEIAPFFAPEKAFCYFDENYLSKLDHIDSDENYIEFCRREYEPIYVSDYALLYESYKRGSLNFAKEYMEAAFQKIYDEYFSVEKKKIEEQYELIRSGETYFFTDDPDGWENGGAPLDRTEYDAYMRGEDPSVWAERVADRQMPRVREVQFQLIQKALATENYDFSDVLIYKEENGAKMRALIKEEYGLEF